MVCTFIIGMLVVDLEGSLKSVDSTKPGAYSGFQVRGREIMGSLSHSRSR